MDFCLLYWLTFVQCLYSWTGLIAKNAIYHMKTTIFQIYCRLLCMVDIHVILLAHLL